MRARHRLIILFSITASIVLAQDGAVESAPQNPPEDKRVFGVIPNNRTTEGSQPFKPITASR
jgi:hypothetical protein